MHEHEAARQNALGDSAASALALERDLRSAEPDRVLFPALIRVALGLLECRAGPMKRVSLGGRPAPTAARLALAAADSLTTAAGRRRQAIALEGLR
jgi:hypothetical protein